MHRARRVFLILFPVLELTGLPSKQFSLKKILFIYLLFLASRGLCCCEWAFSRCSERGLL